jgi:myosin-1
MVAKVPAPPPPPEPDVKMYRAKFAFEGQEGEMSLKKDDLVELVEESDNGWWLVKRGEEQSWAPSNYLELVPPKAKIAAPPPPPARRPAPPPTVATSPDSRRIPQQVSSNAPVKPIVHLSNASNGSPTPWKKPGPSNITRISDVTSADPGPPSSLASKRPPPAIPPGTMKPAPPIATKPAPPTATKPQPSVGPRPPPPVPVTKVNKPPAPPSASRPPVKGPNSLNDLVGDRNHFFLHSSFSLGSVNETISTKRSVELYLSYLFFNSVHRYRLPFSFDEELAGRCILRLR